MGIFKREKNIEERALNYDALIQSLNTNKIYISKNTVERLPVVQESIKKICGTIASLPIELMRKEKDRNTIIEDDLRLYILNVENNNYQTAYNLKYKIVEDLLLYGKHYSYIERKGIKIKALHPIEYTSVTEKDAIDKNGVVVDKDIHYSMNNTIQKRNAYDVLIIDAGNRGVLNSNKLLELMLSHDEMLESVINNISMPSGYLKSSGRLTQPTIDRMRSSWKDIYSGNKNVGKTVILEEGLEYKQLDVNLNNIQSLETKQSFIQDVQRLFNLFDIKSNEDYLKYTISPLISCIENALTTQLLLTSEKEKNTKLIFNTEEVAKASEKERVEAVSMAVKSGLLTINEARQRLNENPFFTENGDFLLFSQGDVQGYKDKIVVPNSSSIISLNDGKVTKEGEKNGEDI